jgi:Type IV secretion system pilin
MGFGLLIILVIAIGIGMAAGSNGLQNIIPALLGFIDSYLIPFLLSIAFLIFVWNAIKYFVIEGDSEDGRKNAKNLALYSIAAFVFIISFWSIVNILTSGIGFDNCNNDITPDYLGEEFSSSAPCTSVRPQSRPNDIRPIVDSPIQVTPLPPP